MEWTDEGFVLAAHPHGEGSAVVQLLTREHGRHAGLLHGGQGGRNRAQAQPGNHVEAFWRARLPEHLGTYRLEPLRHHAATVLDDAARLGGLAAACAVAEMALPEREAHRPVYDGFAVLIETLVADEAGDVWPAVFVRWELGLLAALGFGLDLDRCAATGSNDQLAYVSPRTGRAVSLSAGEPYREKLLRLPPFLAGGAAPTGGDVRDGLILTGHFLARHIFHPLDRPEPAARSSMVARLSRP